MLQKHVAGRNILYKKMILHNIAPAAFHFIALLYYICK